MNKIWQSRFYTAAAVAMAAVILLAVNFIASRARIRVDVTENKIHTLTDNSRRVLAKLDSPVTLRFYYSRSNPQMPVFFSNFANRVENLLDEYVAASGGNLRLEKFDPKPDTEAEDAAMMDGVRGQSLNTGERIYLGLVVAFLDKTVAFPFITPERETMLEYDFTSAISQLAATSKPVVGVMSPLPVMGEDFNPEMLRAGQSHRMQPWLPLREIGKRYEIRKVATDARAIPDNVEVLVVIHPAGISAGTQYAIDQFVMRGGKLLALLDPKSYYAMSRARLEPQYQQLVSSSMDKLLAGWGLSFETNGVVGDNINARRITTPEQQATFVSVIDLTASGISRDDPVSGDLNNISLVFSGAFHGTPATTLVKEPLLQTSVESGLIPIEMANNPHESYREFRADGQVRDLAIRLYGEFPSAFPEGPPWLAKATSGEQGGEGDSAKGAGDSIPEGHLAKSVGKGTVILVGDSDLIFDDICVQTGDVLGQKVLVPLNDNLSFFENMVDNLGGDADLIGIRSRQPVSRPFERLRAMRAQAETQFKERIVALESELRDTERRINEMQKARTDDQRLLLSPEQQDELQRFQQKQNDVRRDLRDYQRELRADINYLGNILKFVNIAMIPILVTAFGIGVAVYRKMRNSAK